MPKELANGKPTTRRYSSEEKAAAVRMVRTLRAELGVTQGTVQRVATQLGYGVESVRMWVKQADIDDGVTPGVSSAEAQRVRELEQENRELRRANGAQACGVFLRGGARRPLPEVVAFIDANKDDLVDGRRLGVELICRLLQVAPSSYYAAKTRAPSARALRDEELIPRLVELWEMNYRVYGVRKLWKAARRARIVIGRDQTARLMRVAGIEGARRSKRVKTTRPDPASARHPDLVKREFTATAPNRLWVTDLTFVPTWAGVAYVCFIVDAFSRMIVGWRVASHMRTEMVLDAIEMARWSRGRHHADLRCHSDAGSQGGFNRSSQHLDFGGVSWRESVGVSGTRIVRFGRRWDRKAAPVSISAACSVSSGDGSPRAWRARPLPLQSACRHRSGRGGSATVAACHRSA